MQTHLSHSPLPQKLEELREYIRREIKKELKIKEGAENLRKVAKDKKSVSDVNVIVKKSNSKLTELKQELQELESQILVSQGNTTMTPGMFARSSNKKVKLITYELNSTDLSITLVIIFKIHF